MTLPRFPTELLRPLSDGWRKQRGESRRRAAGDQGPTRTRRGISKAADAVQVSFILNHDEMARFDRFYDEDTAEGALPFLIPDFATDGDWLMTADGEILTDDEDNPLMIASTLVCQFGEQLPSTVPIGAHWQVSFILQMLP